LQLTLLYQDDWLVAVNKPSGLLVHRSWLDKAETRFAMQMTRDLIGGRHVYPVHRLDRPTSGVLLFALDPAVARTLTEAFAARQVHKEYLALVRGWAPSRGSSTIRSRSSWTRSPMP
jgi:tRNA pseudouridine65 synthase